MALFNFEQRGGAFFNQSQLQVTEPADSNGTSVSNTCANALTDDHAALNLSPGGAFHEQPRQNTYDEQLPYSTNGADQFSRHSIRTAGIFEVIRTKFNHRDYSNSKAI